MENAVDSSYSTRDFTKAGFFALAATAVLSAGWSTTALGATSSLVPCDQVARDLTSLNVAVETLSVDLVDHVITEPKPGSFESIETNSDTTDTMAPLLYLTPRVATILRDVFEPAAVNQTLDSDEELQTSPVAESIEETRSVDAEDEQVISLPRFQRQMFRTDI
jgi:hypothetical protein